MKVRHNAVHGRTYSHHAQKNLSDHHKSSEDKTRLPIRQIANTSLLAEFPLDAQIPGTEFMFAKFWG